MRVGQLPASVSHRYRRRWGLGRVPARYPYRRTKTLIIGLHLSTQHGSTCRLPRYATSAATVGIAAWPRTTSHRPDRQTLEDRMCRRVDDAQLSAKSATGERTEMSSTPLLPPLQCRVAPPQTGQHNDKTLYSSCAELSQVYTRLGPRQFPLHNLIASVFQRLFQPVTYIHLTKTRSSTYLLTYLLSNYITSIHRQDDLFSICALQTEF